MEKMQGGKQCKKNPFQSQNNTASQPEKNEKLLSFRK
jgi:hypothetical protein